MSCYRNCEWEGEIAEVSVGKESPTVRGALPEIEILHAEFAVFDFYFSVILWHMLPLADFGCLIQRIAVLWVK